MLTYDTPIRWGAKLSCRHWAYGSAQAPEAVPAPGDPAHCSECLDWFSVAETVDTLPQQDRRGRS